MTVCQIKYMFGYQVAELIECNPSKSGWQQ